MVRAGGRPSARALSVDVALVRLLAEGPVEAHVHSVFRRVINIVTPAGQMIALCVREHDDAPWSLRADVDDWAAWRVRTGVLVRADRDGVSLSGVSRISLAGGRVWDASTLPITADPVQLAARAYELAGVIRNAGVPGGALPGPTPDPFTAIVAGTISSGLADIVVGELAGDGDRIEAAASSLLGLGPGLTPAGDDALIGLALVVARPGSLATSVLPALRNVLQRRANPTTALSAATLSAALDGRGRQRILDLVDTLVATDEPGPQILREQAGRTIEIGHTSGTDIARGVLAGIELEIQRRGFTCLSPQ